MTLPRNLIRVSRAAEIAHVSTVAVYKWMAFRPKRFETGWQTGWHVIDEQSFRDYLAKRAKKAARAAVIPKTLL